MKRALSWDERLWQGLGYAVWTAMLLISLDVMPVLTDTAPDKVFSFRLLFAVLLLTVYIVPWRVLEGFFLLLEAMLWWLWNTPEGSVWAVGGRLFERFGEFLTFSFAVDAWRPFFFMPAVRTLMFGLGVAVFVWVFVKPLFLSYRVLVLGLFPLLLITVTDTFFPYEGRVTASIVFIMLVFLLVWQTIGRQLFFKYKTVAQTAYEENSAGRMKRLRLGGRWLLFASLLLFIFGAIGYASPKAAPSWPDPVPFLTSLKGTLSPADEWLNENVISRGSGLREDDRRLGGPFIPQENVMFQATRLDGRRSTYHYWRMEAKDTYTGYGWQGDGGAAITLYTSELKPAQDMAMINNPGSDLGQRSEQVWLFDLGKKSSGRLYFPDLISDGATDLIPLLEPYVEQVKLNGFTRHIFYDGYIEKVALPKSQFFKEPVLTGNIESGALSGDSIASYIVSGYRLPKALDAETIEQLAQRYRPLKANPGDFFPWYRGFFDPAQYVKYTQLPETTPDRVRSLARSLTTGAHSPYEAAQAIERYLSSESGLVYETDDVPYVGKDEDFVDQFLFETERGYCDHFSTSMVVMLREVGIPARWVKGFAPGTMHRDDEGHVVTIVRARDAHAWVEAYIPGLGWWPFEPTPAFAERLAQEGLSDEAQTQSSDTLTEEGMLPDNRTERPHPSAALDGRDEPHQFDQKTPSWWDALWGSLFSGATDQQGGAQPLSALFLGSAGYAVLAGMIFSIFVIVAVWFAAWRIGPKMGHRRSALSSSIERLFRMLEKRYGRRDQTMSVRDYTALISDANIRNSYVDFVRCYEAWCYVPHASPENLSELEASLKKVQMELQRLPGKRKLKNEL